MEEFTIKKRAFGGFDREDVARYVEKLSGEMSELRTQRDELDEKVQTLVREQAEAQRKIEALTAECERLRTEADALRPVREEADALRARINALKPDADAYTALRERLGEIECNARTRAADLERRTAEQLKETADRFREQYQLTMSALEGGSAHVMTELRKIEVALAQLPRTMDQTGSELNALAQLLEKTKQNGTEN